MGITLCLTFGQMIYAQELPAVDVQTLDGKKVNTKSLNEGEGPIIISFFAVWCKPCLQELQAISDVYEDWVDETGVRLVAISIDDVRTARQVPSLARGQGWEFDVFLDKNSDFKRAMNVINIPHTFLLDKEGKIVYQHTSYAPGDEDVLYEKVLEISGK